MTLRITPLDYADDREMRAWFEIGDEAHRYDRALWTPVTPEVAVARKRREPLGATRQDWLAWDGDEAVGEALLYLMTEDNLDKAWVMVDVRPGHRGRGVGTALLEVAEAAVPADRTSVLSNVVVRATDDLSSHPSVRFAARHGYWISSHDVQRLLPLPVDVAPLRDRAVTPYGYRLETYVDGVPAERQVQVGELKGLIDVDAPTGDAEWEPSPMSPSDYVEELRRRSLDGETTLETIAVSDNGDVAAYTEMIVTAPDRYVVQDGTLVAAPHRGHRLGMAVKVANLLALADQAPANPGIVTENNEDNRWMVAINEELGFEAVGMVPYFRKDR